ncbi:MAG: glucose-1-phosphate adenylyltransferase [Candidatus Omnitrophota bacterium]
MSKLITFIMAGGKGERLWPLTRDRTKPAVPFGGIYRIIDFALSNCLNSGLRRISVLTQYKSASLEKHIRLGWNLLSPELNEYVEVIPAQQRIGEVWYRGTADAIYQNIYIVKTENPEEVLILAGDHVYKMDYRRMINFHRKVNADLTVAVVRMPDNKNISQFGIVQIDQENKIKSFQEKPRVSGENDPDSFYTSMGIYIFKKDVLMEALEGGDAENSSRYDFGKDIIPKMLKNGFRIYAYNFVGENKIKAEYWRDIGTIDAYYEANMDLIGNYPVFNLYDKEWPIRTYQEQFPPAKTVFSKEDQGQKVGRVLNTLISGGCVISGKCIERCILSDNVQIDSGCEVSDSILMEGVKVNRDAKIKRAIIDKDVNIPSGMVIGEDLEKDKQHFFVSESGIVVVAKKTEIK